MLFLIDYVICNGNPYYTIGICVYFSEPISASSASLSSPGQAGADNQNAIQKCCLLPQAARSHQERLRSQRGESLVVSIRV